MQRKMRSAAKLEPISTFPDPPELLKLDFPYSRLEQTQNGWVAEFLGQSRALGHEIQWSGHSDRADEQLWQMNLHYFEYLQHIPATVGQKLLSEWITECRPNSANAGFAAWAPYAISLRLSAWLRFWSLQKDQFDAEFSGLFSASVREQAAYLASNLETDVRGNHIIKNIRALAEVGHSYQDDVAKRWGKIADQHLMRELDIQILADGVHFERSLSYHIQVFCDLLNIWKIRPVDGLSARLRTILTKMAIVIRDLQHPDSLPVQFNDSGLHMSVSPNEAIAAFDKLIPELELEASRNISFQDSGFFGLRRAHDFFVAKLGKLGPDALMAHAHGDWGSFEWSYRGQRIFVDQGVFEYCEGDRRHQSRSTKNHNTVVVGGIEQADFFGSFRCGTRPLPCTTHVEFEAEGATISGTLHIKHNGRYHKVDRTFEIGADSITISDVASPGAGKVRSTLLLHPDIEVTRDTQKIRLLTKSGHIIEIILACGQEVLLQDAYWWPDMGVSLPSRRLVFTGHAQLVTKICF